MQWRPKKASESPSPAKALAAKRRKRAKSDAGRKKPPKLSRLVKPPHLSLEDWQIQLRRQFGREQNFLLKNLGEDKIFSEFEVTNPQSKSAYRVQIRGARPGDNYCSCPDFATNTLGTCKHLEFT